MLCRDIHGVFAGAGAAAEAGGAEARRRIAISFIFCVYYVFRCFSHFSFLFLCCFPPANLFRLH